MSDNQLLLPLPGLGRDYRKDAALRPQPKRDGPDDWTTPPCLCTAASRYVVPLLPPGGILEPAPGAGALAQVLRGTGRTVVVTTGDFMTIQIPHDVRVAFTNPPFNQLGKFIDRMLYLLDTGKLDAAVLLLRNDHLSAENQRPPYTRVDALRRAGAEIRCCWRPCWIPGTKTNGRFTCSWVAWGIEPRAPILLKKGDVA